MRWFIFVSHTFFGLLKYYSVQIPRTRTKMMQFFLSPFKTNLTHKPQLLHFLKPHRIHAKNSTFKTTPVIRFGVFTTAEIIWNSNVNVFSLKQFFLWCSQIANHLPQNIGTYVVGTFLNFLLFYEKCNLVYIV